MAMTIKSDNKWRDLLFGYDLPVKWRKEFDWIRSDEEYETSLFVKVPGKHVWYHAMSEFMKVPKGAFPENWEGYLSDTHSSGVVIKVNASGDKYKIGIFY